MRSTMSIDDAHPPPSFDVTRLADGGLLVRYRNRIYSFGVFGWSLCAIAALIVTADARSGGVTAILAAVVLWALVMGLGVWLVWFSFSTTTLQLAADHLTWQRRCLGYRRIVVVPRASIRQVIQSTDMFEDKPSAWSLSLEFTEPGGLDILSGHPLAASDWLGPLLARWAAVPFIPATERC